jgi:hypothetical protein
LAGGVRRRGIFIDGGIHAREWIAHAAVLHVLHTLAIGSTDTALSALVNWMLDKADWCVHLSHNIYCMCAGTLCPTSTRTVMSTRGHNNDTGARTAVVFFVRSRYVAVQI